MRRAVIVQYATLCVIWSSTWKAIEFGTIPNAPLLSAGIRFAVAGLVALALALLQGKPRATWRDVQETRGLGFWSYAATYGLIYWAEQRIPSGVAAVLYCITPMLVAWHYRADATEARGPLYFAGALIALIGVALLLQRQLGYGRGSFLGGLAIVVAAQTTAIGTARGKVLRETMEPLWLTALPMLWGAAMFFTMSVMTERWPREVPSWKTLAAIGYLAVIGSTLAFAMYFSLLATVSATSLSLIALIIPAGAVLLGAALGEPLEGWAFWGGIALVLVGLSATLWDAMRGAPQGRPQAT